jgi:hypothetical protein
VKNWMPRLRGRRQCRDHEGGDGDGEVRLLAGHALGLRACDGPGSDLTFLVAAVLLLQRERYGRPM